MTQRRHSQFMRLLGSSLVLVAVISAASTSWADSDFAVERCYADSSSASGEVHEWFSLIFKAKDGRSRTVHIAKYDQSVRFIGTTLADFKWAANYEDLRSLEIDSDSVLWIHFATGESKSVGNVNPQCIEDLRAFDAGALSVQFAN